MAAPNLLNMTSMKAYTKNFDGTDESSVTLATCPADTLIKVTCVTLANPTNGAISGNHFISVKPEAGGAFKKIWIDSSIAAYDQEVVTGFPIFLEYGGSIVYTSGDNHTGIDATISYEEYK